MNKFIKSTLAILTATSFSTYAENTQESALSNFYVSAFVGHESFNISKSAYGVNQKYQTERYIGDTNKDALKLIAGYQFNPNWALELAYIDIGEFGFSGGDSEHLGNYDYHKKGQYGKLELGDYTLAAVGQYEVAEKTNVFAKLGVFTWDKAEVVYEYTTSGVTPKIFSENRSTSNGTNIFIGLGAKYDFDYISVLGDVDVYNINGDHNSVFSVGVSYAF